MQDRVNSSINRRWVYSNPVFGRWAGYSIPRYIDPRSRGLQFTYIHRDINIAVCRRFIHKKSTAKMSCLCIYIQPLKSGHLIRTLSWVSGSRASNVELMQYTKQSSYPTWQWHVRGGGSPEDWSKCGTLPGPPVTAGSLRTHTHVAVAYSPAAI